MAAEVSMEQWQSSEGWPTYPEEPIQPPCSQQFLRNQSYSLKYVAPKELLEEGSVFHDQCSALESHLYKPPLTKKPRGNSSRAAGMRSQEADTVGNKLAAINYFLGFCYLFLGIHQPNFALIMSPLLIAKYIGYHQIKGTAPSSIKGYVDRLSSLQGFVTSEHCPNTPSFDPEHVSKTGEWFANLVSWANIGATEHYKVQPEPAEKVTYWQIIQAAKSKWLAFQEAFQVMLGWSACSVGCMCGHGLSATHHSPPGMPAHRPMG